MLMKIIEPNLRGKFLAQKSSKKNVYEKIAI